MTSVPSTNNFSSYTATLSMTAESSSKSRKRVRTVKGALYESKKLFQDQELEKEARVVNAKKSHRKQPSTQTKYSESSIGYNDAMTFAPYPDDPFEPLPQIDNTTLPQELISDSVARGSAARADNLIFKSVVVHPCPKPKPSKKGMTTPMNIPVAPRNPNTISSTLNDSSSSTEINETSVRPINSTSCSSFPLSLLPQKRINNDNTDTNANDTHSPRASEISKPSGYQRRRVKGADVPYHLKGPLKLSIADYRSTLATHCPFPDLTESFSHAQAALTRSSNLLRIAIEDEGSYNMLVNLLTVRGSHMRGELRTKLTPLVSSNYGFSHSVTDSAHYKNRELVKTLLFKDAFLFQAKEPKNRSRMYSNPILQMAINEMWFQNERDEGIKFSAYFNPIPFPVIALILTVVEHIIRQWESGTYRNVASFTAKEYKSVYLRHLHSLEATEETSQTCLLKLLAIRKSLYSTACKAVGVKPRRDLEIIDDEDIANFEQEDVSSVEDDDSDTGMTNEATQEDIFFGFGKTNQGSNQHDSDSEGDMNWGSDAVSALPYA